MFENKNNNAPDSWALIDETILSFIKNYPEVWKGFLEYMKKFRDSRFNELGASKGSLGFAGDMQHMAKFPSDPNGNNVLMVLEKIKPDLVDNEYEFQKFLKRWLCFKVPEKL